MGACYAPGKESKALPRVQQWARATLGVTVPEGEQTDQQAVGMWTWPSHAHLLPLQEVLLLWPRLLLHVHYAVFGGKYSVLIPMKSNPNLNLICT